MFSHGFFYFFRFFFVSFWDYTYSNGILHTCHLNAQKILKLFIVVKITSFPKREKKKQSVKVRTTLGTTNTTKQPFQTLAYCSYTIWIVRKIKEYTYTFKSRPKYLNAFKKKKNRIKKICYSQLLTRLVVPTPLWIQQIKIKSNCIFRQQASIQHTISKSLVCNSKIYNLLDLEQRERNPRIHKKNVWAQNKTSASIKLHWLCWTMCCQLNTFEKPIYNFTFLMLITFHHHVDVWFRASA